MEDIEGMKVEIIVSRVMYLSGASVKETKKKDVKRKGYLPQMQLSPVTEL